ncbi:MAG: nuclear transport factor 2 family protein [Alphaproteobacteria bacterium]|nr:nuclear transport factor 2 family protein [Alphaproteobacteria bacterium]
MAGNDERAVRATVEEVWDRFLRRDPQGMLRLIRPECTIWDVFQPDLVSRATLEQYVAKDFAQSQARGRLTHTLSDFVIDIWGDTALTRFYIDYEYQSPNAHRGRLRVSVVLRRFAEGWRFVHVHEGAIPTGVPPIAS